MARGELYLEGSDEAMALVELIVGNVGVTVVHCSTVVDAIRIQDVSILHRSILNSRPMKHLAGKQGPLTYRFGIVEVEPEEVDVG